MGRVGALLFWVLLPAGCSSLVVEDSPAPSARPRRDVVNGFEYRIRRGDTLYHIGKRFGVEWRKIVSANPELGDVLRDVRPLRVGEVIVIPLEGMSAESRGKPEAKLPPSAPDEAKVEEKEKPLRKNPGHEGPIRAEDRFVWPLRGRILAGYGRAVPWREGEVNRGIDIAGRRGQEVVAAKSGRVNTFEDLPGYGRAVLLEHTDGTTTLYGNLGEVLAPHGRWVRQGEALATLGASAYSLGVELHFRVTRGESFVDPLSVLPP